MQKYLTLAIMASPKTHNPLLNTIKEPVPASTQSKVGAPPYFSIADSDIKHAPMPTSANPSGAISNHLLKSFCFDRLPQ